MPAAVALFRSILHPSDFTAASELAFAHALKLATCARAKFTMVHTETAIGEKIDWSAFPGVRSTLAAWGLLDPDSPPEAVFEKLGLSVRKVDVVDSNPAHGILRFLHSHPADLVVLASRRREGLSSWLRGSVAEPIAREASLPVLFLPEGCVGFVDPATGASRLHRVLVPLDHRPRAEPALACVRALAQLLEPGLVELKLLHVGREASQPPVRCVDEASFPVERLTRQGAITETILETARELDADLIAMATEGRHGILDTLRGSTSEQVVRRAPCPVLAVPID